MIKVHLPVLILICTSTYKSASFFIFTTTTFITPFAIKHIKTNSFHHISIPSIRQIVFTSIKGSAIGFSNNALIFSYVGLTAYTDITVSANCLEVPRNGAKSFTHFLICLKFHLIEITPNLFLNTKNKFHILALPSLVYMIDS